jgi:hypothetical protein
VLNETVLNETVLSETVLNQIATVSTEAIAQEVSGETVILDLKSEQYFSLDAVGTRIWQLLQKTNQLAEVYEQLLSEYEVEPGQLKSDLEALIMSLANEGLIVLAPAGE